MLEIKQIIPSEACLKCEGCCRFSQKETIWSPFLLAEEIEELLENNIPPSLISGDKKIRLKPLEKQGNFICVFFNQEENKCKIYNLRPFECRLYPFIINRNGEKIFLAIDQNCPFAKKNLENQTFKEYTFYLTDLLHQPSCIDILRSNPQLIQAYSGALNLAELNI